MALERVLLKTIKFDLQMDHPYRHLLQYGKKILGKNSILCVQSLPIRSSTILCCLEIS